MPYKDPIKRAEYHKAYNKKWVELNRDSINARVRKWNKESNRSAYAREYINRSPLNKKKHLARCKVYYAIKVGKLKRGICNIPKCEILAVAHHSDYDKPLDVEWMCGNHHAKHHALIKQSIK